MKLKGKSFSAKAAFVGAILAIAAAIGCIIYGAVYEQYADAVVVLCLLVGAALYGAYALIDHAATQWFGFLGVAAVGFGLGLFLTNSYNVWADTWGNIQQYGSLTGGFSFFNSQGGPIPAAILLILSLISAVCGIISCFNGKETAK
jgi:hypothetical protein